MNIIDNRHAIPLTGIGFCHKIMATAAQSVRNEGVNPMLKTNRNYLIVILLSIVTFGIYPLVFMYSLANDVNLICSRYDGRKSMNFLLLVFVFSWLTLGIAPLVWTYNLSDRIGTELKRRGCHYNFGTGDFWLWNILLACIGIGPLVFNWKLCEAMNHLCSDYNQKGA
jgi:hypothetical protein